MKQETTKSPKKAPQREENRWVDVHNDDVMREMGIPRPFNQAPRDENVWTKNDYERRILKTLRHSCKEDMHFNIPPRKFIPVYGKLIIYLKKNKKFSKTTYSTECWQSSISDVLSNYTPSVLKYSWNGRTYKYGNLPFWG